LDHRQEQVEAARIVVPCRSMLARNRETLFRAALTALVLVAAAVRAFSPRPFPDDYDEVFQLRVIQASSHEFWSALQTDAVHPPLDYLVDRATLWISSDAISHRLPDLLWGTFTVAVLGLLLRRRCGRVAGLIAAGLLALAPTMWPRPADCVLTLSPRCS
jgi:predicted membrane-bound mannosyltransferase